MSDPFLGMIALFGFNFAPRGWAFCNGQLLSIAQNTALFALLGTNFGGNGTSTFGLPDLRGRVPVGFGQGQGLSDITIGEVSGVENLTLLLSNMPSHTHTITLSNLTGVLHVVDGAGNSRTPVGNVPAVEAAGVTAMYSNAAPNATTAASTVTVGGTGTTGPAGSSLPVNIRNPYLGLNYCIALTGIFPSRN